MTMESTEAQNLRRLSLRRLSPFIRGAKRPLLGFLLIEATFELLNRRSVIFNDEVRGRRSPIKHNTIDYSGKPLGLYGLQALNS